MSADQDNIIVSLKMENITTVWPFNQTTQFCGTTKSVFPSDQHASHRSTHRAYCTNTIAQIMCTVQCRVWSPVWVTFCKYKMWHYKSCHSNHLQNRILEIGIGRGFQFSIFWMNFRAINFRWVQCEIDSDILFLQSLLAVNLVWIEFKLKLLYSQYQIHYMIFNNYRN